MFSKYLLIPERISRSLVFCLLCISIKKISFLRFFWMWTFLKFLLNLWHCSCLIFFFFFWPRHEGSSFPTRDWTCTPCIVLTTGLQGSLYSEDFWVSPVLWTESTFPSWSPEPHTFILTLVSPTSKPLWRTELPEQLLRLFRGSRRKRPCTHRWFHH